MKTLITLTVVIALTGCTETRSQNASVELEFRPGSNTPGPGLTEMTAPGSNAPVYVSDEVLLTNADVESASVVSGPNGHQIDLVFTEAGAKRHMSATEQNIMKPIAILVDGKLMSAPVVREKITGGRGVISGNFTEQEAERIADGIVVK